MGSSTTQITVGSRRGSRQIRHCVGLGDVAADLAEPHLVLDPFEGLGQPLDVGRLGREQVEGDALRALGPDAGQPAELVDQVLDRAFEDHRPGSPQTAEASTAGDRAHLLLGQRFELAPGVAQRRHDEVLQGLDVVGVDRGRADRQRGHLAAPVSAP